MLRQLQYKLEKLVFLAGQGETILIQENQHCYERSSLIAVVERMVVNNGMQ